MSNNTLLKKSGVSTNITLPKKRLKMNSRKTNKKGSKKNRAYKNQGSYRDRSAKKTNSNKTNSNKNKRRGSFKKSNMLKSNKGKAVIKIMDDNIANKYSINYKIGEDDFIEVNDIGIKSKSAIDYYKLSDVPYIRLPNNIYSNIINDDNTYILIMYDDNSILSEEIKAKSKNKQALYVHCIILYSNNDSEVIPGDIMLDYRGPTPPDNTGVHNYIFELYECSDISKSLNDLTESVNNIDNIFNRSLHSDNFANINYLKVMLGLSSGDEPAYRKMFSIDTNSELTHKLPISNSIIKDSELHTESLNGDGDGDGDGNGTDNNGNDNNNNEKKVIIHTNTPLTNNMYTLSNNDTTQHSNLQTKPIIPPHTGVNEQPIIPSPTDLSKPLVIDTSRDIGINENGENGEHGETDENNENGENEENGENDENDETDETDENDENDENDETDY